MIPEFVNRVVASFLAVFYLNSQKYLLIIACSYSLPFSMETRKKKGGFSLCTPANLNSELLAGLRQFRIPSGFLPHEIANQCNYGYHFPASLPQRPGKLGFGLACHHPDAAALGVLVVDGQRCGQGEPQTRIDSLP